MFLRLVKEAGVYQQRDVIVAKLGDVITLRFLPNPTTMVPDPKREDSGAWSEAQDITSG